MSDCLDYWKEIQIFFKGDTATANPNLLFKFRKLGLEDTDSELDEENAKKNNQMFGIQN